MFSYCRYRTHLEIHFKKREMITIADLAIFERPASAARRGMEGLGFEESADDGGIAVNATPDEDTDQGLLV
jgi:hypothetical protein